jgi:hypothetical protein
MRKVLLIVTILLGFIESGFTQTVFKGLNSSNSTFLLGAINARKSQCLYKPSDFNTTPNHGEITKIYYRYGSTGIAAPHDLSPFTIKLGQTNDTIFPVGNTFFTGLTTVRFDSIFTIPAGVQGDWFGIDLQTPFLYDSTKTLIVEIKFYNTTEPAFGTLGNNNTTQKLISADTAAIAQTGFGSSTWQDFGFDYLITTGIANINTSNEVMIFPNPTNEIVYINNLFLENDGSIDIFDVYGKKVHAQAHQQQNKFAIIDFKEFEPGIYFIKIESAQQSFIKKVIKY